MSKLISGKEALIALANGEGVQCANADLLNWNDVSGDCHLDLFTTAKNRNGYNFVFRLKPRTITINGIEVPAPFEPKKDDKYFFIDPVNSNVGYSSDYYEDKNEHACQTQFGAWRTEEEVKQVIAALRIVFKPQ
jgi:hypothetical protein